tara:strand:- start:1327 stop:1716 length:390 start_codon:yes stop_codon:yes gene_type:complete
MNKTFLLGRLGKDPESKTTRHKSKMVKFSLATSEFGKDEEGKKVEKTVWHNVVVFNRQAETCEQFLSKGSQVFVEGKLVHRSWDGDDGKKRYATEIHAAVVTFCGEKTAKQSSRPEEKEISFSSEDIPF